MNNVNFVTAAALAALVSLPAAAQTSTPRIDQRQANQERRIQEGVRSGQITPREEQRLRAEQARIRKAEAKAAADGKVTAKERARIEKMQDRASKNIERERHDKQRANQQGIRR